MKKIVDTSCIVKIILGILLILLSLFFINTIPPFAIIGWNVIISFILIIHIYFLIKDKERYLAYSYYLEDRIKIKVLKKEYNIMYVDIVELKVFIMEDKVQYLHILYKNGENIEEFVTTYTQKLKKFLQNKNFKIVEE